MQNIIDNALEYVEEVFKTDYSGHDYFHTCGDGCSFVPKEGRFEKGACGVLFGRYGYVGFSGQLTYTQIKDYVWEYSGLKVSNLYISQIKRKCGIEVGKNYNLRKATRRMDCSQTDSTTAANLENYHSQGLPKSEDSRQPQCPPEKEKAIREAFEYFGLI